MTLVPFVQLEFPGLIGLPEGRYLARDDEGERVLIVQGVAVPRPLRYSDAASSVRQPVHEVI